MPAYKDEKSGKWFASFYYKDWDGQSRKKLKRGFETKKEAVAYERNFTVKMSGSLNMLFEDYFELYKADVIGTIRLNTWITKEHMIRTKILPFFTGMKVSEIKPVVVKKWHNVLLNIENAEGEAYKPTYLKSIHAQLSCMFNHAVKYYGLRQNPCKVTGRIGKQKSDEEVEFWTKDEYLQFIEAVKDKDISFYAFEILYWTGIRLGELRALTKGDFDFDKKTMRICKSAQRINGEEVITDPKPPKSKRTIMLPDFLNRELQDYFLKIEYFSENEQIFPKCKTYFNKEMERGIKKSGVKKIKLHALRHSHISLLIEMGFTPVDIAARTGHESIKVLMDYSHMFPNKQLDMEDKLNKEGEYSESTEISKL